MGQDYGETGALWHIGGCFLAVLPLTAPNLGMAHADGSKEKLLCIPLFLLWSVLCGTTSTRSTSLSRLKMCKQPLGQQCFRSALRVPHASGSGGDSAGAGSAKAGAI